MPKMPKGPGSKRDGRNRADSRLKAVPTEADRGIAGADGRCNVAKRSGPNRGEPCLRPAGDGTDHPGFGACSYHGGNSPSLKRHAAKQHVRLLAQELEMEPDEAIRWMVRLSAGTVAWLRNQIEHFPDEGTVSAEEAAILPKLIEAYGEERDRLAKTAKLAIDAGIAEREMQIMEAEAAAFAGVLRGIFADLKLTAEQRAKAPEIARRHLLALEPPGKTA